MLTLKKVSIARDKEEIKRLGQQRDREQAF